MLQAIRGNDGLIYLEGDYSAQSFWVALERDYALRANKAVFAYNPKSNELIPDTSPALHLRIYPSYHTFDQEEVLWILDFMRRERFFDVWGGIRPGENWQVAIENNLRQILETGGYVVLFWSKEAAGSPYIKMGFDLAIEYVREHNTPASQPMHSSIRDIRILFALLDDMPLPEWLVNVQWGDNFGWNENSMKPFVPLYNDHQRSQIHRMDDLIVQLYWLMYRNTRQNHWQF